MNKVIIYISALLMLIAASCEPVETRVPINGSLTADQLDISATPLVVNGKNSNKIIVENHSPITGEWSGGIVSSSLKSCDTILMAMIGEQPVNFKGLNPDGTFIEKTLTVTVDEISFSLPGQYSYLSGNGGVWSWDDSQGNCYGAGGNGTSPRPDWGGVTSDGLEAYNSISPNQEMVFGDIAEGAHYTKRTLTGEVLEEGTYSLTIYPTPIATLPDMGFPWSIGKLALTNATILSPYDFYAGTSTPLYEYEITSMSGTSVVLSWAAPGTVFGNWAASATMWCFSKK